MKDINEMSYQELLDLEKMIEIAKNEFYDVKELGVAKGHLCTLTDTLNSVPLNSALTSSSRKRVCYNDIFSGEFVGIYYELNTLPSLNEVLDENIIPYKEHMCLTEIEEVWTQYKKQPKLIKKIGQ